MGYSGDKDKLIKLLEHLGDNGSLLLSIFSYDGAKAKLQIHRSFEKKDGTMSYGKMGRLTLDEMRFLKDNIEQIIDIMETK